MMGVRVEQAAEVLQEAFCPGKMCDAVGLAVANDQLGSAGQDGLDQLDDVAAKVLVVAIGVDDDIGAQLKAGVETRLEGMSQAAVAGKPDDVVRPGLAGDFAGAVGGAIVDDEDFDLVYAFDPARDGCNGLRQGPLFVEAGDLHDQLHRLTPAFPLDLLFPEAYFLDQGGHVLDEARCRLFPSSPGCLALVRADSRPA